MSRTFSSQGPSAGFFSRAHHFTIQNVSMTDNANYENYLMESLARRTIPGAEFDSSARDPPPSCHPGTRLDISSKLQSWMHNRARENKLMWVHGPAGVGKSAIMQTLAESDHESENSILGATLFFSKANQRHDPKCVVITIAYQLAVKYQPYRSYTLDLLAKDPKVVEKSLSEQFRRLIVKPFAEKKLFEGLVETTLIILDGLDECTGERAQREIVLLIGNFTFQYPDVPLIWIIASRPEPHIRAAFASRALQSAYSQMEVPINSTQACLDVEKYLRSEFDEIREKYPTSFPPTTQQWPTEAQLTRIAVRSSGLFAFATAVVHFIDDMNYGNPVYKLQRVLIVIDSVQTGGQDNPFAALDALYMEIMSSIPSDLLPIAMALLGHMLISGVPSRPFNIACNWLGINQADAYGALQKLHAVLSIPLPQEAGEKPLKTLHQSFVDFLCISSHSRHFNKSLSGTREKDLRISSQILKDVHNMEERSIQISRINLSWSLGEKEDAGCRYKIFVGALTTLLEASTKSPHVITNECVPILEDLDIESLVFPSLDTRAYSSGVHNPWRILNDIHDYFIMRDLKEHHVVRVVPISTLDLEHVDTRLICMACLSRDNCFDELDNDPSEYTSLDCEHPEVASSLREYANVLLGGATYFPSGMEPEWKVALVQHIAAAVEKTPFLEVILYGSGRNGSVVLCLDLGGERWLILASYKPL